jgi:hypothetical protein
MWKDLEKFYDIVKFLRKLDGRKGSFIEEYAMRLEYLIALNIEMQLERDPNLNKADFLSALNSKGAKHYKNL